MFIVSIFGGLGSQMDQYAFYLALKKKYPDTIIKIEINNLYKPDHNGYELERIFHIATESASIDEIANLSDIYPYTGRFYRMFRLLYSLRRKIFGIKDSWITPDDPTAYYPQVFQLNPLRSYIFFGNWGNESYREIVEKEIRDAFTFPPFTDDENINTQKEIQASNAVSIHIRRGDYLKFKYPIMPIEYYKEAVSIIKEQVKNPKFFVFTDDIKYVKENFSFLGDYKLIDYNRNKNSYCDMQLMSICKHNIIANSSFSFWGAWLNPNKEKIVIAPRYHVNICKHVIGSPSWIFIDNRKYNKNADNGK